MFYKKMDNRRVCLFQGIANRIEKLIADGRLLPGDRLPAERKLAAQLQASRSSVREALRILVNKEMGFAVMFDHPIEEERYQKGQLSAVELDRV